MTGYTVHTGTSKKFVQGWDRVFSSDDGAEAKAKTKKSTEKKADSKKKTVARASTKKKSGSKRSTKK